MALKTWKTYLPYYCRIPEVLYILQNNHLLNNYFKILMSIVWTVNFNDMSMKNFQNIKTFQG